MADLQYSRDQVYAALLEQGYSPERASMMAASIGDIPELDSNILPNLAEGTMAAGALAALGPKKQVADNAKLLARMGGRAANVGRFVAPGVAGTLGYMGLSALTGNNYAEQASAPMLLADAAGGIGGYMLSERLGQGIAKGMGDKASKKIAETAIGKPVMSAVAKALPGKLAGRALGATVGGLLGPGTAVLGSVLGSWLLPKLFDSEAENYLEPDKGINPGTAAGLAGLGLLATPLGRPVRKMVADSTPGKWLGEKTAPARDTLSKYGNAFSDIANNSNTVKRARGAYSDSMAAKRAQLDADEVTNLLNFQTPIYAATSFRSTPRNAKETWYGLTSLGAGADELGQALGEMYRKRGSSGYADGGKIAPMRKGPPWDARQGGPVPVGPKGVDTVPAITSQGVVALDSQPRAKEYVLTPQMVSALGGEQQLEALRQSTDNPLKLQARKAKDGVGAYV